MGWQSGCSGLGAQHLRHVQDAPKARLVLNHQLDGFALRLVLADFGKLCGEIFSLVLRSRIALGMALVGCELVYQPWRCSKFQKIV